MINNLAANPRDRLELTQHRTTYPSRAAVNIFAKKDLTISSVLRLRANLENLHRCCLSSVGLAQRVVSQALGTTDDLYKLEITTSAQCYINLQNNIANLQFVKHSMPHCEARYVTLGIATSSIHRSHRGSMACPCQC